MHQTSLCAVLFTETWQLPGETASRWNTDGAKLTFPANSHAPTGTLFPIATIERLAASVEGVLVLDETYVDFFDPALVYDATALITRYPKFLLIRSLSKGYSLAGLRLGYGFADVRLIQPILHKMKDSYNVDAVTRLLDTTSLDDRAHARGTWEPINSSKAGGLIGNRQRRF